ncbi:6,7-dimethyl-8-ribityllumazine synthase, partial [Salmonella enterica]|uniref:6,7-dimethyl-8-ribityllumazine synthase n=1 Tax=Salmonella enterica TaxID=28901 RepID=UPI000C22A7D0
SLDAFEQYEIDTENIEVAWVPWAYEIPLVAKKMAEKNEYDALICLGAVIRGETTHYDYVFNQAATGIGKVSLDTNLPIIFGVLTTENKDQALERSGIKGKNHGFNYGVDAIEMVH